MVTKSITYFENSGSGNTEAVLAIVNERLKEGDIKNVVVASTSGATGVTFAQALGKKTNLVFFLSGALFPLTNASRWLQIVRT